MVVPGLSRPGTADAVCVEKKWVADIKSGQIRNYREQAMADLLGIPIDEVTQVGLFPVAYTVGTDFKPGAREASADTIRWNRW
jgi:hypothetical protein